MGPEPKQDKTYKHDIYDVFPIYDKISPTSSV